MKKARTRLWGILLVLIMLMSLMPTMAFAAGEEISISDDTTILSDGAYILDSNVELKSGPLTFRVTVSLKID